MNQSFITFSQYGHILYQIPIGSRSGKLIMPAETVLQRPVSWVWYAPTFVPGLPGDRQAWYFTRLLAQGFAVAGMDVGESMGSPSGRELFSRFYKVVVPAFGLDPKACLLPQSRGGLMLYNWAAENPEKVHCVAGIYTVCNINSYPKLDKAAQAYGIPPAQLLKEMDQ
jgi:hypothetical protein